MEESTKQNLIDSESERELANGAEHISGSGFEEEQPEPDFDERI